MNYSIIHCKHTSVLLILKGGGGIGGWVLVNMYPVIVIITAFHILIVQGNEWISLFSRGNPSLHKASDMSILHNFKLHMVYCRCNILKQL